MRIRLFTFLLLICMVSAYGQSSKKLSLYILSDYNKTLRDRTKSNNAWAIGLGVQSALDIGTRFRPTVEFGSYLYLEDDKVLRLDEDGGHAEAISGHTNLFGGLTYQPVSQVFVSFLAGPAFINDQILMGVKPGMGLFLSRNQRWMAKVAYVHVFDRDKSTKMDFSSLNFAIGLKLF
ncbi:hypothetical protein [Pedobacter sp. BAL39]|uniref:hypothetical protein n=1 Tax=Pedobacter sp. BAL39 TaxID=391596 RepID=UPI0012F8322D|nr:hypothetical protein [Pedobacter sp. BAL39]